MWSWVTVKWIRSTKMKCKHWTWFSVSFQVVKIILTQNYGRNFGNLSAKHKAKFEVNHILLTGSQFKKMFWNSGKSCTISNFYVVLLKILYSDEGDMNRPNFFAWNWRICVCVPSCHYSWLYDLWQITKLLRSSISSAIKEKVYFHETVMSNKIQW